MSLGEIVEGTLKPDGTLELDHKPNLAPGRVQVIVQALPALPDGDRNDARLARCTALAVEVLT